MTPYPCPASVQMSDPSDVFQIFAVLSWLPVRILDASGENATDITVAEETENVRIGVPFDAFQTHAVPPGPPVRTLVPSWENDTE